MDSFEGWLPVFMVTALFGPFQRMIWERGLPLLLLVLFGKICYTKIQNVWEAVHLLRHIPLGNMNNLRDLDIRLQEAASPLGSDCCAGTIQLV